MLEELYVKNLVIFEEAPLPFGPGLNVISGETGAGKSLIAGAIGLALGARASADSIRQGEENATVSAVFSLPPAAHPGAPEARRAAGEAGFDPARDETLLFERRLSRTQSSRLSLCGRPLSAAAALPLASALIDIAAQNEHTRLTESPYQRELLDRYGRIDSAEFTTKFLRAQEIRRMLEAGELQKEKARLELERIRYKLEKIDKFAFDPASDPQLESRIAAMSNAGHIREVAQEGATALYDGDGAVCEKVGALLRAAEKYEDCSPELAQAAEELRSALAALEDASRAFRHAEDKLDFSPEELDAAIERAEGMKDLARLLECPDRSLPVEEQIPQMERTLRTREAELAAWEGDTGAARQEMLGLLRELAELGRQLRQKREQAGKKLAKAVNAELVDLGMPQANFAVTFRPLWEDGDEAESMLARANAGGLEEVCFVIAPNPGEAPSSLAESASGGEASRTMLALKTALAAAHCPPTLLFDEIDSGVGGRLGDALGRKLRALANDRQVIVITHLPQIAAYADRHIKIAKQVRGGRTNAGFTVLEGEERTEEIAQMIHGGAATATTRKQAAEMLAAAGTAPAEAPKKQ